jgi:hypothetical protein
MGYAISWLAVRNNSEADVLAELGFEKTGEKDEVSESGWCSARLGEWTIVRCNRHRPSWSRKSASKFPGEVIVCDVEEHVMFASTAAFNDGAQTWRVEHDAQKALDHLVVSGQPLESLARIRAEQFAQVDEDFEVDFIFEIPVRMAQEIVGFRHDAGPDLQFDALRVAPGAKTKWKFW